MSKRLKSLFLILLVIPAVMLPVYFLGPIWHLVHGNFIVYRQWKIRVPYTFYVTKGENGPFLWKLPFGFPLLHNPYAVIGVSELPRRFDYDENYQGFMAGADLAAGDQGYKFLSNKEVPIGKTLGHCLEYGLPHDASQSFAQCAIDHSSLWVSYRGHAKYFPILFSTLQSISVQNADAVQSR